MGRVDMREQTGQKYPGFRGRIWLVAAMLLFFSVMSLSAITTTSATFDEVQNFGIGKYLLLTQRWDVMGSIVHPPIGFYLTSLPLLFVKDNDSLWQYEEQKRDLFFLGGVDVVRGQGLLSAPENANDRLLISIRLTVLVLALVLGWYIYLLSREFYGESGAILSLALYTFCPNMLAYSGIATQDLPLAAFSFLAAYQYWQFLQHQSLAKALIAGSVLGLAIATKFTALLLVPFLLLAYVIYQARYKRAVSAQPLVVILAAGLVLLLSFGGQIKPLQQAFELLQLEMAAGQSAFFHGELANHGWWNFYPAVLLIKTPLPILVLLFAALVMAVQRFRSDWFGTVFLVTPVIGLLLVCSASNFAIGTRYLLPIYPFIFVLCGSLTKYRAKGQLAIFGMICWLMVGTLFITPHYLSYFNELVGGAANGYRYLVDSNLDWGQDLKLLKRYMVDSGTKRISLSYFGADSPQRYGIEYDWLPSHYLSNPEPDKAVMLTQNQPVVISATNLQGVYLQNPDEFKWFRGRQPIARIGYSMFVYDLNRQ